MALNVPHALEALGALVVMETVAFIAGGISTAGVVASVSLPLAYTIYQSGVSRDTLDIIAEDIDNILNPTSTPPPSTANNGSSSSSSNTAAASSMTYAQLLALNGAQSSAPVGSIIATAVNPTNQITFYAIVGNDGTVVITNIK